MARLPDFFYVPANKPHTYRETFAFFPRTKIEGEHLKSAGKLISSPETYLEDLDDLIVVLPGLPGESRPIIENALIAQVRKNASRVLGGLVLFPEGIKSTPEMLNVTKSTARRVRNIPAGNDFFGQPFSLTKYVHSMRAALRYIKTALKPEAKIHVVGQSFGVHGVIQALQHASWEGYDATLNSCTFLAPFMKVSPNPGESSFAMDIVNPICSPDVPRDFASQMGVFEKLATECDQTLNTGKRRFVLQHRDVFTQKYFHRLKGRPRDVPPECHIRIVYGGKDPFINPEAHIPLLTECLNFTPEDVEIIELPNDDHTMESFDYGSLLSS